ncbi:hypothetical protein ACA910_009169 [Epithemia clementina (nom. ined.)]
MVAMKSSIVSTMLTYPPVVLLLVESFAASLATALQHQKEFSDREFALETGDPRELLSDTSYEYCRQNPALCCQIFPDWSDLCGPRNSTFYDQFCYWFPHHWLCNEESRNICELSKDQDGCQPFCDVYWKFDFCEDGFCDAHPGYLGCLLDDLSFCVLAPHLPGCYYPGFPAMGSSDGLWPFSVCAIYPHYKGCDAIDDDTSDKTPTEKFCELFPDFEPFCMGDFDVCLWNNMAVGCPDYCAQKGGQLYPACLEGFCDDNPKFFGCNSGYDVCPFYHIEGCPSYPGLDGDGDKEGREDGSEDSDRPRFPDHPGHGRDRPGDHPRYPYFPGYGRDHPGGGYFPCPGVPLPVAVMIAIPVTFYPPSTGDWPPGPYPPQHPVTDERESCGPRLCRSGELCCNESCGICTEPGGGCTKQICLPPVDDDDYKKNHDDDYPMKHDDYYSGRKGGYGKKESYEDDHHYAGHGDYGGKKGSYQDDDHMRHGSYGKKDNYWEGPYKGRSADGGKRDDAYRHKSIVVKPTPPPQPLHDGVRCGHVTCRYGEVCCNESCSICAMPDEFCVTLYCGKEAPLH